MRSPILLPPGFAKALRPSSAVRAPSAPWMNTTRSATACGSRIVVYRPGSSGTGLRDFRAFSIAVALTVAKSIFRQSLCSAPAQPDPVPSAVRTVSV